LWFAFLLLGSGTEAFGENGDAIDRENGSAWNALDGLRAAEFSGTLVYFERHRERYRVDEGRFGSNLHHQTLQGQFDFSSPFFADTIGVDVGVFATTDLSNSASPDHELSFFPWENPWSPDWSKRDAESGASLYRAHLKLRHAHESGALWGKLGDFQPTGPGVLGVNWSLMPGTYRGAEGGGEWSKNGNTLAIAGAYVTKYKAPWYRELYAFRKSDGQAGVDHLWSLGARYQGAGGLSTEIAYGEARDFLQSAHLKFKYRSPESPFSLSYQLYVMGDRDGTASPNNHYAGKWATQHYLAFSRDFFPYTLKTEFLHTRAPSDQPQHLGYFVYRLSGAYGGANGAYEPWWDNRSDWNHHRESAVFVSVSHSLNGLIGELPGVVLTLSAARGWGGKVYGVEQKLRESAWSFDLTYLTPAGPLKNTRFSLHYTRYNNKTRQPSWEGFKNLFQDERDLKFFIIVPWKI
jgi:hypothetical protein